MIIGISGKRGVGKTLAANHIAKEHKFKVVSFAGELKSMARSMFKFSDNDLTIPTKKESPWKGHDWSPRDFMIHLGEFMRFHETDYWLNRGIDACVEHVKNNYVFDDVRYINEADAIRKLGGVILRIERYEKHNPYGKNLDTPSETDLDKYTFDYTVERVWNIEHEDLFRQVDAFITAKCGVKAG